MTLFLPAMCFFLALAFTMACCRGVECGVCENDTGPSEITLIVDGFAANAVEVDCSESTSFPAAPDGDCDNYDGTYVVPFAGTNGDDCCYWLDISFVCGFGWSGPDNPDTILVRLVSDGSVEVRFGLSIGPFEENNICQLYNHLEHLHWVWNGDGTPTDCSNLLIEDADWDSVNQQGSGNNFCYKSGGGDLDNGEVTLELSV